MPTTPTLKPSPALSKAVLVALLSCAIGLGLAGCSPGCEGPAGLISKARGEVGGSISLGIPEVPTSLNPLSVRDPYSADLASLLFPPLVFPQEDGSLLPGIAEAWDISDDGLTVTFQLRADLHWSDKAPIVSKDVKFSHEARVKLAPAGLNIWGPIESVTEVDASTVAFRFIHPVADPAWLAGMGSIVPAHVFAKRPPEEWGEQAFTKKMVTGGRFRVSRVQGDLVTLAPARRVPDELKPLLATVNFKSLGNEAALVESALEGDIDFLAGIPLDRVAEFQDVGGWRLRPVDDHLFDYIGWNTTRAPFDDQRMRQAMTAAIDKEALVRDVLKGFGRVGSSPIHSTSWAFDNGLPSWPLDRDSALEDLAEIGWSDSDGDGWLDDGGGRLSFSLLINDESPLRARYAGAIRDQLRAIGVHVVVRTLPMDQLTRLLLDHDFDAVVSSWQAGPTVGLPMLHSKGIDGGYNYVGFSDPAVDRLLDEAEVVGRVRGAPLWSQVQARLHEAQPYTVLAERLRVDGATEKLRGVLPSILPLAQVDQWWVPVKKPKKVPTDKASVPAPPAADEALQPEEVATANPEEAPTQQPD